MKRIIISLLSVLSILAYSPINFAADNKHQTTHAQMTEPQLDKAIRYFYKNPSYDKLITMIDSAPSLFPNETSSDLFVMFVMFAIDAHPDYVDQIISHFASYSKTTQKTLVFALVGAGKTSATDTISKKYHYPIKFGMDNLPEKMKSLTLKQLINDQEKFDMLDILWSVYFATGNSHYLQMLLEYINADQSYLLAGYEIVNRQSTCNMMAKFDKVNGDNNPFCKMTDIHKFIKSLDPSHFERNMKRATSVSTAIWSMDSNCKQDPTIEAKINELFNKYPDLNYPKKIKESLR